MGERLFKDETLMHSLPWHVEGTKREGVTKKGFLGCRAEKRGLRKWKKQAHVNGSNS